MVQEKLEEVVWPESKNLVHDMVRNKEIDTWRYAGCNDRLLFVLLYF